MHISKISSQRQITIPKKILDKLGLGKHDRLKLEVKQGKLTATPLEESLTEKLAGSLKDQITPNKLNTPFKTALEETRRLALQDYPDD